MNLEEKIIKILKGHEGWVDRSMTKTCLWSDDYKEVAKKIAQLYRDKNTSKATE